MTSQCQHMMYAPPNDACGSARAPLCQSQANKFIKILHYIRNEHPYSVAWINARLPHSNAVQKSTRCLERKGKIQIQYLAPHWETERSQLPITAVPVLMLPVAPIPSLAMETVICWLLCFVVRNAAVRVPRCPHTSAVSILIRACIPVCFGDRNHRLRGIISFFFPG